VHNRISGILMLAAIWLWYRPFVTDFRRRLDLAPASASVFYRRFRETPMIGAYSPELIPHPADWPENFHVSGYLFLDSEPGWKPSPELDAFLHAGPPPVYIGFGSMAGENPEELADLVTEALSLCGRRGVIVTGWGGLKPGTVSGNVFVLESAPHDGLFPRMAAVVHHGGAGTTAEGLRAGKPTVVVPFLFDQSFWGSRIRARSLGPVPVPRKKLTAARLAEAITSECSEPLLQNASAFGAMIRSEDGTRNAVRIIGQYLEKHGKKNQGNRA
jgi:sterol 3beta-glucosyltransferase